MFKKNQIILLIVCLILLNQIGVIYAECINNQYGEVVCREGTCLKNRYGEVYCAVFGGDILRDQYGDLQCGVANVKKIAMG